MYTCIKSKINFCVWEINKTKKWRVIIHNVNSCKLISTEAHASSDQIFINLTLYISGHKLHYIQIILEVQAFERLRWYQIYIFSFISTSLTSLSVTSLVSVFANLNNLLLTKTIFYHELFSSFINMGESKLYDSVKTY